LKSKEKKEVNLGIEGFHDDDSHSLVVGQNVKEGSNQKNDPNKINVATDLWYLQVEMLSFFFEDL